MANRPAPRSAIRKLADVCLMLIFFGLVALLIARINQKPAAVSLSGNAYVIDGDTLVISKQHIRLQGIDAPELAQTCGKPPLLRDCGQQAREALQKLVTKTEVRCEEQGRDKFNRILGTCFSGQNDLNRMMVETGQAIAYGDYRDAEMIARGRKLGIWAEAFETPQEWRRTHHQETETSQPDRDPVAEVMDRFVDWITRLLGGIW
ncbi:thermonuclease family protein [Phyllobacterium sp. YR531]|uniref:thermonuclease family protein n=1 Tax=Phyllobacterium sp. YR531 TaxID=1144343 RepID=UPI000689EAA9|nr:thermonuclease family protein [Phyllobacterium sp. YR531]